MAYGIKVRLFNDKEQILCKPHDPGEEGELFETEEEARAFMEAEYASGNNIRDLVKSWSIVEEVPPDTLGAFIHDPTPGA